MDVANLSKEEAIELHRQMWQDMYDANIPIGTIERNLYKEHWLEVHGIEGILCSCFLCHYACQQWEANGFVGDFYCRYCPLSWRKPCSPPLAYIDEFYCEQGRDNIFYDWRYASANTIANLPVKEE